MNRLSRLFKEKPLICIGIILGCLGIFLSVHKSKLYSTNTTKVAHANHNTKTISELDGTLNISIRLDRNELSYWADGFLTSPDGDEVFHTASIISENKITVYGISELDKRNTIEYFTLYHNEVAPEEYSVTINTVIDVKLLWTTAGNWKMQCNGKEIKSGVFKPGKYEITITQNNTALEN